MYFHRENIRTLAQYGASFWNAAAAVVVYVSRATMREAEGVQNNQEIGLKETNNKTLRVLYIVCMILLLSA